MSQATFLNRQALYLRPDPARVVVRPFKPATEPRDLNPTEFAFADRRGLMHLFRICQLGVRDGSKSSKGGDFLQLRRSPRRILVGEAGLGVGHFGQCPLPLELHSPILALTHRPGLE